MKKLVICLLLLHYLWPSQAQSLKNPLLQAKIDVIYLASDYLQGREAGTAGEDLAAEYIVARFREIGLVPKGEDETYLQAFAFNYSTNPHAQDGEARIGKNVLGYIDNEATNTIVIGAHYDHLGKGAFGSRHLDGPIVHNGADDNASGISGLLYLAQALINSDLKSNNYLFIAFSGEELGLFGSKHFVKYPTIDLAQVNYMLNMDMIGRLESDRSIVANGSGTSPMWEKLLEDNKHGLKIEPFASGIGPSDHTSFYLADIPVLHFFSGTHTDYHKPSDDSELINYDGIMDICNYMMDLIADLDDEGKITFTKTKDESQQQVSDFKVTLGIMPDYAYDGKGMRLDAALDNRPAKKAGMKKGDVIIQMGSLQIEDIYDYMDALGTFEKGQKAKVLVKRGKQKKEMEVEF